jgi:hypothetical protein
VLINGLEVGIFSELPKADKTRLQQLAMILCPQVFGTSSNKFDRVNLVFLEFGPVLSSNVRDLFSAGGKSKYTTGDGHSQEIRSIDSKLRTWAVEILTHLNGLPELTLRRYWGQRLAVSEPDRLEQYLKLIDQHSQNALLSLNPSTLFLEALAKDRASRKVAPGGRS